MEILATSFLAFLSTNIDDIFLLVVFYLDRKFKEMEIVIGQLMGIMSLTAVSLALSFLGLLIDKIYIGLFGLVPVYLGLRALWNLRNRSYPTPPVLAEAVKMRSSNMLAVAAVTFANGGDNIAIYVPLFATLAWWEKLTMVIIFLLMTLLWCLAAKYLAKHPYLARAVNRYGHILTPFVLILLGIYILYENQSIKLFMQ